VLEQALLERGVLGIVVIALAFAVMKLYNDNKSLQLELREQERNHRKEMTEVQISFHETSRDQGEQMVKEIKEFSNRLISLSTSYAELGERTAQKLHEHIDSSKKAFRAIEQKIDETNHSRRSKSDQ